MAERYWASEEGDRLTGELYKKLDDYRLWSSSGALAERVEKAYQLYYGENHNATSATLSPGGQRGELTCVYVNLVRYLVQNTISLIAGQRLTYDVTPKNAEFQSREDAMLSQDILSMYVKDRKLEAFLRQAVEYALVTGEAFVRVDWNPEAGSDYTTDEMGNVVKEGDVRIKVYSVFDVVKDITASSSADVDWIITRDWVNRWDLVAQYPELEEKIRALTPDQRFWGPYERFTRSDVYGDRIPLYTFYHRKTPALPEGKQCQFLSSDCYLTGGPLGYTHVPVYRIAPDEILGTSSGYSPVFDLMGLSDAYNGLASAALSNQMAFGVQNLAIKRDANVEPNQLAGGLNVFYYDFEPPAPINFTQTAPEIFNSMDMYKQLMVMLMGQNDTSLGQIESSSRLSASAMAMLEQKAIQYSSVLQESYISLAEHVGSGILDVYRVYATAPRTLKLIGKDNASYIAAFKGSAVEGIDRVTVQIGNPAARTVAMKYNVADSLLKAGLLKNPTEYFDLLGVGTIEQKLRGPEEQKSLVIQENEMIMQGIQPRMLATDEHALHIAEHAGKLANQDVRQSPEAVQAGLAHIQEHIGMYVQLSMSNPALLFATGQPPAPVPPPPPVMGPGGPQVSPAPGPQPQPEPPPGPPPGAPPPPPPQG